MEIAITVALSKKTNKWVVTKVTDAGEAVSICDTIEEAASQACSHITDFKFAEHNKRAPSAVQEAAQKGFNG